MRTQMPMRSIRPRLLLLPLMLGVVVVPAFLTGSTAAPDVEMHAGAVCSNDVSPAKTVVKPRSTPTCVNCRAPLLNAPLARAEQEAPPSRLVALPPAA